MPMSKLSRASLKGARVLLLSGSSSRSPAPALGIFARISKDGGAAFSKSPEMESDSELRCGCLKSGSAVLGDKGLGMLGTTLVG